jgi:glycosyltransferase involved in cell wall biosynthesis
MEKSGILILTPEFKVQGGVSNFFEALRIGELPDIRYFFVSFEGKENVIQTVWRLIGNYIMFAYVLCTQNIGLVHINPSLNKKSFFRDGVFILICRLLNTDALVFFHGWEDSFETRIRKNLLYRYFFKYTYQQCKEFAVLSKIFKQKLIKLGCDRPEMRYHLMTTVADTSFLPYLDLNKKSTSFKHEKTILFLSRIEESKGIFIALTAFKKLQIEDNNGSLKLIVAGDGKALESAKDFVQKENIQNVHFTGYVRGQVKGELLLNAHILLFPTYYGEGMPTNVLEAMLYGMPIVSRYNAGISDTVVHGVNGLLTDSKDPEIFAEMLKVFLEDEHIFRKFMLANHYKAIEHYSSEKVRDKVLSVYDIILHKKQKTIIIGSKIGV